MKKIIVSICVIGVLCLFNAVWAQSVPVEFKLNYGGDFKELASDVIRFVKETPGDFGIVIKDMSTQDAILINKDEEFAAASVIKIFIMLEAFNRLHSEKIALNDIYILSESDKTGGSGVLRYYRAGIKVSVKTLIDFMITKSDNTATNMLIDILGMNNINKTIEAYGFTGTKLRRKILDFNQRSLGVENTVTASDIALFYEKLYEGDLINKQSSAEMKKILLSQESKDRLAKKLPDKLEMAHKTGRLSDVNHDAGIIYLKGRPYLICVLTRNLPRFSAENSIAQLSLLSYNYFSGFAEKTEEIQLVSK